MNILAISHLFPNINKMQYGIFVARQLFEMSRLGANIHVIVPMVWCPKLLRYFKKRENYGEIQLCKYKGLETHSISFLRLPGNWFNRWSGQSVFHMIRRTALELHKQNSFDIIYSTDLFPDGSAAVKLGDYLNIPASCLAIGVDVNITAHSSKSIHKHFVNTVKKLDGTLACGQSVADGIKAVTNLESLNVYGVVETDKYRPVSNKILLRKELGLPFDKTIGFFAGYLSKRKGVYEIIEAFDRVRQKDANSLLFMAGEGAEELKLKALIEEKGLGHIIRMVGNIDPDIMHKWMSASDFLVLASHTEGLPNVVMEAMSCGLPVVASAVGGLPYELGDCKGVILIEPKNVDDLVQAMLQVIEDDNLRNEMSIASRERAEKRFDVKRNAQRILDYLENIKNNHSV